MTATERTIIEVNGVKLEVDLRTARRIDEIRIGDTVKVLTKQYDGHKVSPGVVIGFEPFTQLPTIVVAYVENSWAKAEIKFVYYNSASKDIEIVHAADDDFSLDRADMLARFDREIAGKEREIDAIREQRAYFERHFQQFWSPVTAQ